MTTRKPRTGQVDAETRAWVRERDDFTCHYCNRRGAVDRDPDGHHWHVDHKTPRSMGGDNGDDNLALACERCNRDKRDSAYDDFVATCAQRLLPAPIVEPAPPVETVWAERRQQAREASDLLAAITNGVLP